MGIKDEVYVKKDGRYLHLWDTKGKENGAIGSIAEINRPAGPIDTTTLLESTKTRILTALALPENEPWRASWQATYEYLVTQGHRYEVLPVVETITADTPLWKPAAPHTLKGEQAAREAFDLRIARPDGADWTMKDHLRTIEVLKGYGSPYRAVHDETGAHYEVATIGGLPDLKEIEKTLRSWNYYTGVCACEAPDPTPIRKADFKEGNIYADDRGNLMLCTRTNHAGTKVTTGSPFSRPHSWTDTRPGMDSETYRIAHPVEAIAFTHHLERHNGGIEVTGYCLRSDDKEERVSRDELKAKIWREGYNMVDVRPLDNEQHYVKALLKEGDAADNALLERYAAVFDGPPPAHALAAMAALDFYQEPNNRIYREHHVFIGSTGYPDVEVLAENDDFGGLCAAYPREIIEMVDEINAMEGRPATEETKEYGKLLTATYERVVGRSGKGLDHSVMELALSDGTSEGAQETRTMLWDHMEQQKAVVATVAAARGQRSPARSQERED